MEEKSEKIPENCAEVRSNGVVFTARDWLGLAAALGLALLWLRVFGDGRIFSSVFPGSGAAVFTAAIWAAVLLYLGGDARWNRWNAGLCAGVGLLAAANVVYGDSAVRFINCVLILCGSALAFFSLSGSAEKCLTDARVIPETFRLTFRAIFTNCFKPFRALGSVRRDKNEHTRGVLVGVAVSIPVLALVIWLLASADAVFGGLLDGLPELFRNIDITRAVWRVIRAAIWTLLIFSAIYFLRHTPERAGGGTAPREAGPDTPFITVLCLLDAVYAVFVVIQIVFLFGGAETAAMQGGYAAYARSGFFQLVFVTAINVAAALICASRARGSRAVRILAAVLLGLTAVILFSALKRMQLYIDEFGMSLLRAMTLWAMAFIAVCIVLAALRVFRSGFRFWPWFAVIGLAGWIIFNFINIDARIAEWNVGAYMSGDLDTIDADYLASLSANTLPALEKLETALADGSFAPDGANAVLREVRGAVADAKDAAYGMDDWIYFYPGAFRH